MRHRTPFSLLSGAADTPISTTHPLHTRSTPLPSSLSLHTLRAPISTLLRRLLAASSTTTSTSQQRTCCETRPATASSSLCRAPPFVWGSGFKGEWASMQGRMGGAAADRDNVCGEVSHAAIWVGGAMRVGGGLCVAAGRRRGPTDAPTPRAGGGADGAVTRCARFWFCECV